MGAFCEFRKFCLMPSWRFPGYEANWANKDSRKMKVWREDREIQNYERKIVRCPLCNKRLRLKAVYGDWWSEFSHWQIPEHKPRVTRDKSPKRKTAKQRRGR